jgi:hypothetical protein
MYVKPGQDQVLNLSKPALINWIECECGHRTPLLERTRQLFGTGYGLPFVSVALVSMLNLLGIAERTPEVSDQQGPSLHVPIRKDDDDDHVEDDVDVVAAAARLQQAPPPQNAMPPGKQYFPYPWEQDDIARWYQVAQQAAADLTMRPAAALMAIPTRPARERRRYADKTGYRYPVTHLVPSHRGLKIAFAWQFRGGIRCNAL